MVLVLKALDAGGGEREIMGGKPFFMGRGPDNDWVLADPGREISKIHCRIDQDGEAFVLTDLSINGVYLDRDGRALGRGGRHRLSPGDLFSIGQHRFGVAGEAGKDHPDADREPLVPEGVRGILAGQAGGQEPRASAAITGEAQSWLGTLPSGAAADGLAQPFGWIAPPVTATSILPSDFDQDPPASELANASEHAVATASTFFLPQPRQLLPPDWNGDAEGAPTLTPSLPKATVAMANGPATGPRAELTEAARLSATALADISDNVLFERAGELLRALIDGLDTVEAAQAAAELACGLENGSATGLWTDVLTSTLDPCTKLLSGTPAEAGEALAQRITALTNRQRAMGAALTEAIRLWDERLAPDRIAQEAVPRFAVGPLGRAALWTRYVEAFRDLAGQGEAGAEPRHPLMKLLRSAFGRQLASF